MTDKLERAIEAIWMQYVSEDPRTSSSPLENLVVQARALAAENARLREALEEYAYRYAGDTAECRICWESWDSSRTPRHKPDCILFTGEDHAA